MKVMAQMAHGDEPRQVHRVPHLLGDLQAGVDQPRGVEYVWFNNVETRPGQGYPRGYEDQDKWKGGWVRTKRGKLKLRAGGRLQEAVAIFSNPKLPRSRLLRAVDLRLRQPASRPGWAKHFPVARPKSLITGKPMKISWSANWDDDLGGSPELAAKDPVLKGRSSDKVSSSSSRRSCSTCRASASTASTPRAWRRARRVRCTSAARTASCWSTRTVPRLAHVRHRLPVQEGLLQPPDRQGREVHLVLPAHRGGPADGVLRDLRRPAALHRPVPLRRRPGHRSCGGRERAPTSTRRSATCSSTPTTRRRPAGGARDGIPQDWLDAAERSPVYALAKKYKVALPLHPEYRTMPMVWYIPPLSPGGRRHAGDRATTPRTPATCSGPSTPCGSRSSTSPTCSPPGTCALDSDGGVGMGGSGPVGEGSGRLTPVAVENLRVLKARAAAGTSGEELVGGGRKSGRVNLLSWDGKGIPEGLFPPDRKDG
jgi:hypothetical protein